jgi:RNA polymerase sigma-70 factor (ECF subfamily)
LNQKASTLQARKIEQQFEDQIREHGQLLHKVCRMYTYTEVDHQDLFQDIVVQLWQAYPKFKGEAKFSTWLYRVAINTAISVRRNKKVFITSYEPANLPLQITDEDGRQTEEEMRLQQLYKAIEQLNEVEKAIVMLYMEERSYEEMEAILGISGGTLRVKMNRVKEKLRHLTKTTNYGT